MSDGDPSPPYLIQPGTNVRLFSDYDGAERRLGESPLTSSATSPHLTSTRLLVGLGCSNGLLIKYPFGIFGKLQVDVYRQR